MEDEKAGKRDEEFVSQKDSGLTALEQAYNNREVSLSGLLVGAVIVALLAGILVAFVLFGGN